MEDGNLWRTLAEQLPVAFLMLLAIFFLWREFKGFLRELNASWQAFITELRDQQEMVISTAAKQIEKLTDEVVSMRRDFDAAVTRMDERTRRRNKDKE